MSDHGKPELRLVEPTLALEAAYLDLLDEYRDAGRPRPQDERARSDFAAYVRELRDHARGRNLPEGLVPCSTYWLVRGGRVVGACSFRHRLNEHLEHEGGHIGYGVRPSERGKGYATAMLAMVLERLRPTGLGRALVTCDTDNAASARVIEKNGGRLEDVRISHKTGKPKARYWIELGDESEEVRP